MPTGYTFEVEDGKITELKDYMLRCSRAFGVCLEIRDESLDVLPPKKLVPSSYYKDKLKSAEQELARLKETPKKQLMGNWMNDLRVAEEAHENVCKSTKEHLDRYENMYQKVLAWKPPATLARLKEFMLSQIDVSREHMSLPKLEEHPTFDKWKENRITRLIYDIEYYSKEYDRELKRVGEGNEWLELLWKEVERVK